jgi:hypothetical protein
MSLSVLTKKEETVRYGYICDCGCGTFYLIAPNAIECSECGMDIPDTHWIVMDDDDIYYEAE